MFVLPDLPDALVVALQDRGEFFARSSRPSDGQPPVLMIHGWGVSADTNFFPLFAGLERANIPFVAPDLRGHGRSVRSDNLFSFQRSVDDIIALLDVLGIDKVTPFGFSMGGPIAIMLADQHPDRVAGLVIGSSAATLNRWGAHRLLGPIGFVLTRTLRSDRRSEMFLRRFIDHEVNVTPEIAAFRDWYHGELRRGSVRDIAEAGREITRFSLNTLSNIKAIQQQPAVVLASEHDSAVPIQRQISLAKTLDARLVRLPGDHDIFLTHRHQYTDALVSAVTTVQQGVSR
jgi:pimeloyl-ACP methyl ester carboxylesterase